MNPLSPAFGSPRISLAWPLLAILTLLGAACVGAAEPAKSVVSASPAAPAKAAAAAMPTIDVAGPPVAPPEWALWERQILDRTEPAVLEFIRKYTREDGSLIWRDKWPGMDGSDDSYESFYNFPLLYALGGPEGMDKLARKEWEAMTKQWTAYGQIYNEFDGYYDWMHHGESSELFYLTFLSDPTNAKFRERAIRFAGLYTGDDPKAPNYDAKLKMIRSPITGSRGPRFVNSAEDWGTNRPVLALFPLPYDDIPNATSPKDWLDDAKFPNILDALNRHQMRGDVPLNLTATSMVLNAYMLTGEAKYKTWITEYVDAWIQRTRDNKGIIPDNIGPSGKAGEMMDGKWWGGYYGWRWPHGIMNLEESTVISADQRLLPHWRFAVPGASPLGLRSPGEGVQGRKRPRDGPPSPQRPRLVRLPGDRPHVSHPSVVYHAGPGRSPAARIADQGIGIVLGHAQLSPGRDSDNAAAWLAFIEGRNPNYPLQILKATYDETLRRMTMVRTDTSVLADNYIHHWQQRNPVILEALVQLTLGAPNHIYHGGLLHTRLFYFDPVNKRPGLPPGVAALVDKITPDGVSVHLVNIDVSTPHDVVIQAGAFGEHRFETVRYQDQTVAVGGNLVMIHLGPSASGRLDITMKRYAQPPHYGTAPEQAAAVPVADKTDLAKGDIRMIEAAAAGYNMNLGNYPASLPVLLKPMTDIDKQVVGAAWLEKLPIDPWGHPYQYQFPSSHGQTKPDIWCIGPDGQPIANWQK